MTGEGDGRSRVGVRAPSPSDLDPVRPSPPHRVQSFSVESELPPPKVDPEALGALLASSRPPLLLDVRPWDQRSIAHLPGDRWIPLRELSERVTDLPQNVPIIVYCHHGWAATQALEILRAAGQTERFLLEGGIDEYARRVDPTIPRYGDDAQAGLVLQQFPNRSTGCLAYLLHDRTSREAVIVDPGHDIAPYRQALADQRLHLRAIVETHTHADHLSGHAELHSRTDAPICVGHRSEARYPHEDLTDGQAVDFGGSELLVLETPGHTPDHISLRAGEFVFTGDTLLPGSCGRTDLGAGSPELLWESLTTKLLVLPEETEVFPAHYGRLHGLPPPERYSSTIGFERTTNEALNQPSREAFLTYMTEGWPPKPAGFQEIVRSNLRI